MTLVYTAGHVHPGGLCTDLTRHARRQDRAAVPLDRQYYEPAGAVSWDVSMTATPPDWRVQLKTGDVLNVSGTYDTQAGLVVRGHGDHADGRLRRHATPAASTRS